MDELTQSNINLERVKALKNKKILFKSKELTSTMTI